MSAYRSGGTSGRGGDRVPQRVGGCPRRPGPGVSVPRVTRERRWPSMDPSARSERAEPLDAEAFVRFCYRRRRVGWPDLYDEMCRVAHRGLFHGMGPRDLAEIGIGFSLHETAGLAALVTRVAAEEQAARARSVAQGVV